MLASLSTAELALVAFALALGGFTKGLTGLGLPLVAVPVLAGIVGVERAVLTMVIPSFVLNVYPAWTHRSGAPELPELKRLLIAGLPGAALGAGVLQFAGERLLAAMMAVLLLAYLAFRLARPSFSLASAARRRWSAPAGAAAGALQAATGISAPVIAPYMDALRLTPTAYVFAVSACFATFAGAHLGIVAATRVLTLDAAGLGILAILPAIVFLQIGVWARRLVSRRAFELMIRVLLALMALRLGYGAFMGAVD